MVKASIVLALLIILTVCFTVCAEEIKKTENNKTSDESLYRFGLGAKIDEESTAKLASSLGLDWIRFDSTFIWGDIEPSKGSYNFENADELVRNIQKYNVRIIGKITSFAEWDGCKSRPHKPNDMDAYKEFVKKLVERYDGDGIDDMPGLAYPIKYWIILNEVEDRAEFNGTGKDYAETLKASYEAIKEADPDAKVLISAPGDPSYLQSDFWKEVLENSAGYFDYGNIHYNVGSELDKDGFEDLSRGFKFYRETLASYGIDVKVFGTEVSPAPGDLPVDERAKLWVVGSVKSFAEGAVGIKYPYVEDMLKVLVTMTTLLKNFENVEKLGDGYYRFKVNSSYVYVAWGPAKLNLSGNFYVVDVYGNVEEMDASSIEITDMPKYILKDSAKIEELKDRLACIAGDVNGDGSVDVLDLTYLVNVILGESSPTAYSDVNGDGSIDVLDLTYLVNIILGS